MIICYSDVVIDCTYQVLHVYHHFLFLKVYGVQTDSNKVHNFLGIVPSFLNLLRKKILFQHIFFTRG